ncbi:hypothetical protein Pla163_22000 [Planctomycetes bacterium Pla163]|uniref:DUF1343 domain-containing protein n=1 Tax=Rohdeia mirabilis TaxID=2528008 RepID=A0A518D0X3_9BACT|nr:hypothetical protein Pla163_22000 [Planctomycetes bacterium Pla163]
MVQLVTTSFALAAVVVTGLVASLVPPRSTARAAAAAHTSRTEEPGSELLEVLCGIDVLERDDFAPLADRRVGLITNHTGLCRDGRRTVDVLWRAPNVDLVALFSPEHGFEGVLDEEGIAHDTDAGTGLVVHSLYGETRRPTAAMLEGLDVLVFDIQDIGCRFYTYVSTMGLALEAAAEHGVAFVVLDRPNPLGGDLVEGPVQDAGLRSFVGFHEVPVRHGLTVGELARMFVTERELDVALEVVRAEGWQRAATLDRTDLVFTAPSPNMRRLSQALFYPGVGLLEFTNLSVGRGTDTPFERIGAPWIDGPRLARAFASKGTPGVAATPVRFVPASSVHAGEVCEGLDLFVTDRSVFRSLDLGYAIAQCLRELYPEVWDRSRYDRLLGDADTRAALEEQRPTAEVRAAWERETAAFRARRAPFLLYD